MDADRYSLVVAIVNERVTAKVVDVVRRIGGQAITVVRGRGRSLVDTPTFLGMPIESERELLYLVLDAERAAEVARAVHAEGDLDRPGQGIVFVVALTDVLGFVPRGSGAAPAAGGATST
jgi:nitrogen regulatory protein P-II 1